MAFPPIEFKNKSLRLLDQTLLPEKEKWITCKDSRQVYEAIRTMIVRGAPAIGIAGGYGLYLGIAGFKGNRAAFEKKLKAEAEYLKASRPTGVNLRNVIDSIVAKTLTVTNPETELCMTPANVISSETRDPGMMKTSGFLRAVPVEMTTGKREQGIEFLKEKVLREAILAHKEDDRLCRAMGRYGARLFRSGDNILTHCNAGGLATSGYGTALGVIYAAVEAGKKIHVYADETRPLLQGARLTAWELSKSGIPCTLLCDNMAASVMRAGKIDRVIVGADRIAANGDTANKIGTYGVAVLAKAHGIPFYVAAPGTTFDFSIRNGRQIPIEERKAEEVTEGFGKRTAPRGIRAANPAFDVTPHELITAFFTEAGVLRPPFNKSFLKLKKL